MAAGADCAADIIEVVEVAEIQFEVWGNFPERAGHSVDGRASREINVRNMLRARGWSCAEVPWRKFARVGMRWSAIPQK